MYGHVRETFNGSGFVERRKASLDRIMFYNAQLHSFIFRAQREIKPLFES